MKVASIPRLRVTKSTEQTLVLLLALHEMRQTTSYEKLLATVQTKGFWRGNEAELETVWTEKCLEKGYINQITDGNYYLSQQGIGRLHDLSTLAFALRDPFKHLTSQGYLATCEVRKEMTRRPFATRTVSRNQPRGERNEYHVYVILLEARVVEKYPYLIEKNPKRRTNQPCLYVGCTGKTPELRFEQHKYGRHASEMVKQFGVCLVPDLYAHLNPINGREQAEKNEKQLAEALRRQKYTVTAGHHDWPNHNRNQNQISKQRYKAQPKSKPIAQPTPAVKFKPANGTFNQRMKRARALARVQNQEEIIELIGMLEDENESIRYFVGSLLTNLEGTAVVNLLAAYLQTNPATDAQEQAHKTLEMIAETAEEIDVQENARKALDSGN